MSFADVVAADRRLIILRLLVENEGAASESVIERGLLDIGERKGIDREVVKQLIRDLAEKDCVKTTLYRDKLLIADITTRGVAVAAGRITVDGIAKPSLGC